MSSSLVEIYTKQEWDACIKRCDFFDFYHTYDYHQLAKLDDEFPVLLKYENNGVLIAIPLLIRKINGTTYKDATSVYGYPGPITKGVTSNFDNTIFKNFLTDYFESNNFISVFSRLNPYIKSQCPALSGMGNIVNHGKVVNINIKLPLKEQRKTFQSRLRTHINKSRRNCSIKEASSENDLQEFINIYYENMDRVNAKISYYFSKAYFEKIMKSKDFESIILLATDNETKTTISGCLFVITNNIVQYHLSGSKNDFLYLTPTKLLIDEMRILATKRNLDFFNLGGGLGGRADDSLFRFKSSFSKDFKNFNLWKWIVNNDVYQDLAESKRAVSDSDFFPLYRSVDEIKY
ncbi:peptidoglycan bridge formation glycyltransferase FemA/FemB family protein [Flavobacteriaceae bacterium SZ-1-7]|uniref:peptidoglycan bridge formation glycyltransferase FemA/FemB family protein n=1 Tax=Tamlana sedimenti TaxID=3134126 RepID=UPI003121EB21